MARIWVALINISPRTAAKIMQSHDIEPDEVRLAVVGVPGLRLAWDEHAERGRRALVTTAIPGREALIVLYPVGPPHEDEWNLGSAYFTGRRGEA
ncbi:hypothetical protein [Actinomycetospora sp. CA-084318]|uniref:hypothetical protein n=1 Tax=Actinomycetospora sp. CA-084318 TaxID=3239892 RepID=UPI003D950DEF